MTKIWRSAWPIQLSVRLPIALRPARATSRGCRPSSSPGRISTCSSPPRSSGSCGRIRRARFHAALPKSRPSTGTPRGANCGRRTPLRSGIATPDGEESVAYAELVAGYRWTRWFGVDPAAVVGFVRCYDYQSCEHDGWRSSDACDFTTRLMAEAAERLAKAALGDAYPWFAADPVRNDSEDVARRWATRAGT